MVGSCRLTVFVLCSPWCHEVACSPSSVVQTPAPGLVPGGSQVFVEREHQTSTYILFRETDANMLVVTVDESYLRMTKDDEGEWSEVILIILKHLERYKDPPFTSLYASLLWLGSVLYPDL